jgi:hypothetical protein
MVANVTHILREIQDKETCIWYPIKYHNPSL